MESTWDSVSLESWHFRLVDFSSRSQGVESTILVFAVVLVGLFVDFRAELESIPLESWHSKD